MESVEKDRSNGHIGVVAVPYERNPIIQPGLLNEALACSYPYRIHAVSNPSARIGEEGETELILRFEDRTGHSGLVLGESYDGISDWVIDPDLIASPEIGVKGREDPRTVLVERLGWITTCVSAYASGSKISFLRDRGKGESKRFEEMGEANFIYEENGPDLRNKPNKDACLLPVKVEVRGRSCFALIHRPSGSDIGQNMWISFSDDSDDIINWWGHRVLAWVRPGTWWDSERVGLSSQPLLIPEEFLRPYADVDPGLLLINHGVKQGLYRHGLMWFSLEHLEVTYRSKEYFLGPDESLGSPWDIRGAVFICGAVLKKEEGEIWFYYGIADHVIGVARMDLEKALKSLFSDPISCLIYG